MGYEPKTLRQVIEGFSDYELDSVCVSMKSTVKTQRGGRLTTTYSERANRAFARARLPAAVAATEGDG